MRIAAAFLSLLIFSLLIGLSVEKARAADNESETIYRLEREWLTAYMKGDIATVDRLETPSYTAADDETGQDTKAEQLKGIEQRQKRDLGASITPEKHDVRFFGDVALLTGLYDIKLALDQQAERTQITEVWVKQGGKWKVEHIQYATLKPTPAR